MKLNKSSLVGSIVVLELLFLPIHTLAIVITFDDSPPVSQQGYGEGSFYEEKGICCLQ